ncbi:MULTISPECIES: hypothetical protein [unclassified Streptomyces]|uniref:hypothetical protein n=1 Tax=unclassified Streptomyces TaxID=2593676 RepID=UPI0037B1C5AE
MRNALVAGSALIAVLAVFAGIKWLPRGKAADSDALCWGALSPAQAKPLLSNGKPATATESAADAHEATCDVRTGDDVRDIQFVLTLHDGMQGSVTPPDGIKRLSGSRAGWATQAEGRIRLTHPCAYALHRDGTGEVDLILTTTIQVRKHYNWKSTTLVPRVSQVLRDAAEGIERHHKCGSMK